MSEWQTEPAVQLSESLGSVGIRQQKSWEEEQAEVLLPGRICWAGAELL